MAYIIYWQGEEIDWVVLEGEPQPAGVDLSLLGHICPTGWNNVLLVGKYVLNRSVVRP